MEGNASSHIAQKGNAAALTLCLGATAVAAYLTWLGFRVGAAPPGCGSGSGCAEVLGSRWSSLFGLPVGLPALIAYLGLAAGLFLRQKSLTALCAGAVLGGALWFTALQLLVIRAICPYCMVDHTLGALAAVLALRGCPRRPAMAGGLLAAAFALLQVLVPQTVHSLDLPTGNNYDLVLDGRRRVGLLEGAYTFDLANELHVGSLDAERVVFLMLDYACPHCRRLHLLADEVLQDHPDGLLVVSLPTPIHPDCNPAMTSVPDRFAESCGLAAVSIAVFEQSPEAWPAFDRWMFEPEMPRSLAEVRERAAPLLGADPEAAESAAWQRVKRNIMLFTDMPVEEDEHRRVPVTWWVHQPPVIGPIEDKALIWERAAPVHPEPEIP